MVTVHAVILLLCPPGKNPSALRNAVNIENDGKVRMTEKADQPADEANTLSLIEKLKRAGQPRSSAIQLELRAVSAV